MLCTKSPGGTRRPGALLALASSTLVPIFAGCTSGDGGLRANVVIPTFAPVADVDTDKLTVADVNAIVESAALSIDSPNVAIAVVDRIGNILRVWNRAPGSPIGGIDNEIAVSLARTAAFLSHSQAPLTSRTGQFISTFHFPVVFDLQNFTAPFDPTSTAPTRPTLGVANTGQGPLWQIDASNRGANFGPGDTTPFNPGSALPFLTNPDGSVPAPGFTPLPGALPLYKTVIGMTTGSVGKRLVGAIGVYVTTGSSGTGDPLPEVGEFAAISGAATPHATGLPLVPPDFYPQAEDYLFPAPIPAEGAVYLVGVLLPAVGSYDRPSGVGTGTYVEANTVFPVGFDGSTGPDGTPDPFGYLVGPRSNTVTALTFTAAEVQVLVDQAVQASLETHAAIRLPASSPCAMVIAVTDSKGAILALNRMNDATVFSADIAIAKARESFYFSDPNSVDQDGPRAGRHPLADIVPAGTAVTARSLGFLTQPFFPPGIDTSNLPGPLYDLALENRKPVRFNQMGFAPPAANQSGLIFFPGSAPIYRNGVLIGGFGVSGDGVEQDDLVTTLAIQRAQTILGFRMAPNQGTTCDNFQYQGVRIPYSKFPQNPGG